MRGFCGELVRRGVVGVVRRGVVGVVRRGAGSTGEAFSSFSLSTTEGEE